MKAYLQHGEWGGPYRTESVPVKEAPMYHHEHGLSYTATGYGMRLPTRYMVQVGGRWRRVYSVRISNVSTEYIGPRSGGTVVTLEGDE